MRLTFLIVAFATWVSGCANRQAVSNTLMGPDSGVLGSIDVVTTSQTDANAIAEQVSDDSLGRSSGGPEIKLTLQPNDLVSNQPDLKPRLIVHDFPTPHGESVTDEEFAALMAALRLTTLDGKSVAFDVTLQKGKPLPAEPDCSQKPCVPGSDGTAGWDPARIDIGADLVPGHWYRLAVVGLAPKFSAESLHPAYLQSKDQLQPSEAAAVRFGLGSTPMVAQFTTCRKEDGTIGAQLQLSEPISSEMAQQILVAMAGQTCTLYNKGIPSHSQSFTCPVGTGAEVLVWSVDLSMTAIGGKPGVAMPTASLANKFNLTLATPGVKNPSEPCIYERF